MKFIRDFLFTRFYWDKQTRQHEMNQNIKVLKIYKNMKHKM